MLLSLLYVAIVAAWSKINMARLVYVKVGEAGQRIGEDHPNSKYSDEYVACIQYLYDSEKIGFKKLARIFGIPEGTVRSWIDGRSRCQFAVKLKKVRKDDS